MMFPSSSFVSEFTLYDFESEENASKWKNTFTNSLPKVLSRVHPKMVAKNDALEYVESLVLRTLAMLCASPPSRNVQDVEERVLRTFPKPLDECAISEAQAVIKRGRKKTFLCFPIDQIHSQLRDTLQSKIDYQVTLFIVAVLEYIAADILKLGGSYVRNVGDFEVSQEHIRVAMCADKVLTDMFLQDVGNEHLLLGRLVEEQPAALVNGFFLKELIIEEKTYIRELQMIRKVFWDKLRRIPALQSSEEQCRLDEIFSNINEIYEFSVNLLASLEDSLGVSKEEELAALTSCFEELAEGAEFDVYVKYGEDVLRSEGREALLTIVNKPDVSRALTAVRKGFKEAVKYYLPRLLLVPVNHVFSYFKYIEVLLNVADNEEIKESLEQIKGLLCPLQSQLDRAIQSSPYSAYLKRKLGVNHRRSSQEVILQKLHKLNEIQKSIEGWEGKDIAHCCSEFIMEGSLKFGAIGRKQTDRHLFLFDGLLVLCKCKANEYKFRMKFLMRMVDIIDRDDTDELRHSFEILPRHQPSVVLSAKSAEEKNNWMAALVRINTQSLLERILDSILLQEEKDHPWLLSPDSTADPLNLQEVSDSDESTTDEKEHFIGAPFVKKRKYFCL